MKLPQTSWVLVLAAGVAACTTSGPGGSGGAPPSRPVETQADAVRAALGSTPQDVVPETPPGQLETEIVDPKTGVRLLRIPKSPQYMAKDGLLYNVVVSPDIRLPIVREDETAWYIPASPKAPKADPAARKAEQDARSEALGRIVDIPAIEAEVVTPVRSRRTVNLQEMSDGLPDQGQWRENFQLVDLDGDGRLEIVTPPPRLSAEEISAWKLDGLRWKKLPLQFEDPLRLGFGFGGLSVGDLDGDGKLDMVFGTHSGGLTFVKGLGGLRFRLEKSGLPREFASTAVEFGDLDGDGRLDVVALSEQPERQNMPQAEIEELIKPAPEKNKGKYRKGFDVRSFFFRNGAFEEVYTGLASACWGYSLALHVPPAGAPASDTPFYVSSCRSTGTRALLYQFDKQDRRWRGASLDVIEPHAVHMGVGVGQYQGHEAAFVTYLKVGPRAGRVIDGDGISVYYRDGETWKRKRVLKRVDPNRKGGQQGLGVGDLDGDGLDDLVLADEMTGRLRIFLQTKSGEFEEVDSKTLPTFVNEPSAIRIADMDGDGRKDIVFMFNYRATDRGRSGGFRYFRNLP